MTPSKRNRSEPRPTRAERRTGEAPLAPWKKLKWAVMGVGLAARRFARRGWHVFPINSAHQGVCTCPLGPDCTRPGKHPPKKGGVHNATADLANVEEDFCTYFYGNVAIATGEASGFIVLDVDPRHDGEETMAKLVKELGDLPVTVTVDTGGGGYHHYFQFTTALSGSRHDLPGVDLQSNGAYVIAPPSVHVSGRKYRWREGLDPDSVLLAELPAAWVARLTGEARKPAEAANATPSAPGQVAEGGRNTHLTSLAGSLHNAGIAPEAMLAALLAENAQRCRPPLDDSEVQRIATSIGRYAPGGARGSDDQVVARVVLDETFAGGKHLLHLADGQFWAYSGSRWAVLNENVLSGVILRAIEAMPSRRGSSASGLIKQVLEVLKAEVAKPGDPLRFNATPPPVINLRNGELWIIRDGALDLRPHSHTSLLRHQVDIAYDPDARCPLFDEALLEIFSRSPNPQDLADFWCEIMGYVLQPERRIPAVFLGWGEGNDGKTTLGELLVKVLGRENVLAMPIADLEKSRFTMGALFGKQAYLDDDVKTGTRLPDGHLKRLSEAKTVTGENKFGPPFTFTARAAPFMFFNNPPSIADLTYGMQRRLIVIPFKRRFKESEVKGELFPTIMRDELSGVLNRFLEGLQRVIRAGWRLERPQAVEATTKEFLLAANPLPAFVAECCESGGFAWLEALHQAYQRWAEENGIKLTQQKQTFRRNLENLGYKAAKGNEGKKMVGLKLRLPADR